MNRFAGLLVQAPTRRLLLLRRSTWERRRGTWESPGGHVDPGERAVDAAVREFREETGYENDIRSISAFHGDGKYTLFRGLIPFEFRPELSDEHDDFAWVMADRLPRNAHPGLRDALLYY